MTDTLEKYLTLRGANNDIYFFQKRVNEKVAEVIGTSFVKTSLKTKVLDEAILRRDELISALNELEKTDLSELSEHFLNIFEIFEINFKVSQVKVLPSCKAETFLYNKAMSLFSKYRPS